MVSLQRNENLFGKDIGKEFLDLGAFFPGGITVTKITSEEGCFDSRIEIEKPTSLQVLAKSLFFTVGKLEVGLLITVYIKDGVLQKLLVFEGLYEERIRIESGCGFLVHVPEQARQRIGITSQDIVAAKELNDTNGIASRRSGLQGRQSEECR